MYDETLQKLSGAAATKANLLKGSILKYLIASILAGLYIGLGFFLVLTVGGVSAEFGAISRILMGVSFGVALSLVIMAGSELFTGNNLIMAAGVLNRSVKVSDVVKVWVICYIGNLIGSIIVAWLYSSTGLASGVVGDFIQNLAAKKISLDVGTLFFRGILCNLFVCLAVLCAVRMKSETAKLIMIFWCLFAFLTTGYEHSIANMGLFAAALFLPHTAEVSLNGAAYNLFWVTFGNIVGGSSLGALYFLVGRKKGDVK